MQAAQRDTAAGGSQSGAASVQPSHSSAPSQQPSQPSVPKGMADATGDNLRRFWPLTSVLDPWQDWAWEAEGKGYGKKGKGDWQWMGYGKGKGKGKKGKGDGKNPEGKGQGKGDGKGKGMGGNRREITATSLEDAEGYSSFPLNAAQCSLDNRKIILFIEDDKKI